MRSGAGRTKIPVGAGGRIHGDAAVAAGQQRWHRAACVVGMRECIAAAPRGIQRLAPHRHGGQVMRHGRHPALRDRRHPVPEWSADAPCSAAYLQAESACHPETPGCSFSERRAAGPTRFDGRSRDRLCGPCSDVAARRKGPRRAKHDILPARTGAATPNVAGRRRPRQQPPQGGPERQPPAGGAGLLACPNSIASAASSITRFSGPFGSNGRLSLA